MIKNEGGKIRDRKEKEKSKRERERERKKKKNRKYGQTKLVHSKKGILSCVQAGIAFVTLVSLIVTAYLWNGTSPVMIGSFGIAAVVLAMMGISSGIRGLREREKKYITCRIGIGCNIIMLLGFTAIFVRGLI